MGKKDEKGVQRGWGVSGKGPEEPGPAQERSPRVLGANTPHGHLLDYFFFPKKSRLFQISHPKDLTESRFCSLAASQGTPGIANGME